MATTPHTDRVLVDCCICSQHLFCTQTKINFGKDCYGDFYGWMCITCSGISDLDTEALDLIFEKAEMPGPCRTTALKRALLAFKERQRWLFVKHERV